MTEGPVVAAGAVVLNGGRLMLVKRANPPEAAWIGIEDLGRYPLVSNMSALNSRIGHLLGIDIDGKTPT